MVHFVAAALAGRTLGILAGPLWLGVSMIVLALVDGQRPPPVRDVFGGCSTFLPSFLLVLLLGLFSVMVSVILQLSCGLAPLTPSAVTAIMTVTMFSIFLAGERHLGVGPAIQQSFEWVKPLGLAAAGRGAAPLGAVRVGCDRLSLGVSLTAPLYTCAMAVAYRCVAGGPPPLEPPPASSVPPVVDTPLAPAAPPVGSGPAAS